MRFLVDENLSPRICPLLADGRHQATHVRDEGMAGATDPQVLAAAAAGGLILITADRVTSAASSPAPAHSHRQ